MSHRDVCMNELVKNNFGVQLEPVLGTSVFFFDISSSELMGKITRHVSIITILTIEY